MLYKLFLDDLRTVDMVYGSDREDDYIIVSSYNAFVSHIQLNGLPNFISFDNDLGEDHNKELLPDGYACAKWLVYESGLDIRNLNCYVHSANPVAKVQIESLLTNFKFFEKYGLIPVIL